MISHENMKIRQQQEEDAYRTRMHDLVNSEPAQDVLPITVVQNAPNKTIGDLEKSIDYLDILLGQARNYYSQVLRSPRHAFEGAKKAYYKSLCSARDWSIYCLELSGELLKRGGMEQIDPEVLRIVRYFVDIQDSNPNISPGASASLKRISIFDDGDDPFEMIRFRDEMASSICSLATIPSGRILLKSLFDLRYYDPKLDHSRRTETSEDYLPSTMRIRNPYTNAEPPMVPTADTTQKGADGQISKDNPPKVVHGDFRQDVYVFPPIVEYNDLMQTMLTVIPSTQRSPEERLQHLAQINLGHEMIHTVHISYGVALNDDSSGIRLEERVTSGDEFGAIAPQLASKEERADSVIYDYAEASVKEAFIVSERSLRSDYNAVSRHSYRKRVDMVATDDELTQDERYVYLFADELINDVSENGIITDHWLLDWYTSIQGLEIEGNEEGMNKAINDVFESLKTNKEDVINEVFETVFDNMIFRQFGKHLTQEQEKMKTSAKERLEHLLKSEKSPFYDTLVKLLKIRIRKDILSWALRTQSTESVSSTDSSSVASSASSEVSSDSWTRTSACTIQ